MDIHTLSAFFKWCSIINGVLLILTVLMIMLSPNFVYSMQSHFFAISREAFDETIYELIGLYKILFLVFNLVPYVALRIITKDTD